jgi:hypothetical protein
MRLIVTPPIPRYPPRLLGNARQDCEHAGVWTGQGTERGRSSKPGERVGLTARRCGWLACRTRALTSATTSKLRLA